MTYLVDNSNMNEFECTRKCSYLHLVLALKEVPDGREEGRAKVQVPDRRPQRDDGEQVAEHRLVVVRHSLVNGWNIPCRSSEF